MLGQETLGIIDPSLIYAVAAGAFGFAVLAGAPSVFFAAGLSGF